MLLVEAREPGVAGVQRAAGVARQVGWGNRHRLDALQVGDQLVAADRKPGVLQVLQGLDDAVDVRQERFVEGARQRAMASSAALQLFEFLEGRVGYLLSGAYALALATLGLKLATLKAHAPKEFARVIQTTYVG